MEAAEHWFESAAEEVGFDEALDDCVGEGETGVSGITGWASGATVEAKLFGFDELPELWEVEGCGTSFETAKDFEGRCRGDLFGEDAELADDGGEGGVFSGSLGAEEKESLM